MGLVEGVKDAVGDAVCFGLGGAGWVAKLLAGAGLPLDGIQESIDRQRAISCGEQPGTGEPVGTQPNFTGGQCPGVPYRITGRWRYPGGVGGAFVYRTVAWDTTGKVRGIEERFIERINRTDWYFVSDAGEFPAINDGIIANSQKPMTLYSVAVDRLDGQPDDCGDPEGDPPEGIEEHDDVLPPVTYPDKDGNPVSLPNLPVKFFKPCVNLDGVRIPFEVDLGFTKICGKVGIGFDIADFDVSPNIDIDVCPSQKESLDIPQETLENYFELELVGDGSVDSQLSGDLATAFDPDSNKIMGVFVRGVRDEPAASRATIVAKRDQSEANLLLPRIGQVVFECYADEEAAFQTGFTEPISIKNVQQFIPCPWTFGAVSVSVVWEDGWNGSYYIARRKSCCEACASADPNAGLDNYDRCRID